MSSELFAINLMYAMNKLYAGKTLKPDSGRFHKAYGKILGSDEPEIQQAKQEMDIADLCIIPNPFTGKFTHWENAFVYAAAEGYVKLNAPFNNKATFTGEGPDTEPVYKTLARLIGKELKLE